MNIADRVIDKMLSGRFITTVMLTTTYCSLPLALCAMAIMDKIKIDFFTGYLAGFSQTVLLVLNFYYDRKDRHTDDGDKKIIEGMGDSKGA